jgi:hypothetical protein
MCAEWRVSYPAFLKAVGRRPSPEHSIGRKDNNRGYEPGNVAWETAEEQANNKRTSRVVTVAGVSRTVAQWARELKVNDKSLYWLPDEHLADRILELSA